MSACDRAGCWSSVTYPVQIRDPNEGAPYFGRLCRKHHDEAEAAGHLVPRITLPTSGRAPGIVHDAPVPRPAPEPTVPHPKTPDTVRLKARALRAEGKTHTEIGDLLGISKSTAYRLTHDVTPEGAKPKPARKAVARKSPPAAEVRQDAPVGPGAETTSAPEVEAHEHRLQLPPDPVEAARQVVAASVAACGQVATPAPHPLASAVGAVDAEAAKLDEKLRALYAERDTLDAKMSATWADIRAISGQLDEIRSARATLARLAGLAA